jgi:hypothetical protein
MNNTTTLVAAKTIKELFSGFDTKRSGFFTVEGAQGKISSTLSLKLNIT